MHRLYALHGQGISVSAFAIDTITGHARPINRLVTGGLYPSGLAASRDGRSLLIVHGGSGHVSRVSLAPDGSLQSVAQRLALPDPARPRDIVLDPTGGFAVLADPGRNGLFVLRLGAADGLLSLHQFLPARPGDRPCRVQYHPRLPVIYAGNAGNPTVTAYHWHARSGQVRFAQAIRSVPAGWAGAGGVTDLAFTREGRRLYALNAGHGSVTTLALQPSKGKMFVRSRDETGGRIPRAFAHGSGEETLLISHDADALITRFAISPVNGTIGRMTPDMTLPGPAALAVIA